MAGELTYTEIGATLDGGDLPSGYSHLHDRVRIGQGETAFRAATEALATFRMHRRLPVGVNASARRAEVGADVRITLAGIVHAPCRIVRLIDEPHRYGWAYGTLTGHPEHGEEAFLLTWDADGTDDAEGGDGPVWFEVIAFSRPGSRATRAINGLIPGLIPVMQRLYARRCGMVLRGIARAAR